MARKSKTKRVEFSHYTYFTDLFYLLVEKKLWLSNPESWKDKTDSMLLKSWAKNNEKVRAICFFMGNETNHYWELYAKYGCKIEFNQEKLLSKIPEKTKTGCFDQGEVKHIKRNKGSKTKPPFIKQYRYRDEREYRIVWKGTDVKEAYINIDLNSIKRITISGDIDEELMERLKNVIPQVGGKVLEKKICRSTLYEDKIFVGKNS